MRLKHRTVSAAIVESLRDEVLSGARPAGVQLRQDALASSFGVSRIPVREALLQLEAEGLVQIVPHKGAVVSGLSREEVDDIFDLRILLETRLLRRSVPLLTDVDFKTLDRLQSEFAKAIRLADRGRWGALNAELHAALYSRSKQPRTLSIVSMLLIASERYTRIQLATPEAWRRAEDEHREIIDLCQARDVEGACAALARHIAQVHRDLATLLDKRQVVPPG